jgi:hypothetical protein
MFSDSQYSLAGTKDGPTFLKRGFFRQVRDLKVQWKNPGNALRMTNSHLRCKAKDSNKLAAETGRKVKEYTG